MMDQDDAEASMKTKAQSSLQWKSGLVMPEGRDSQLRTSVEEASSFAFGAESPGTSPRTSARTSARTMARASVRTLARQSLLLPARPPARRKSSRTSARGSSYAPGASTVTLQEQYSHASHGDQGEQPALLKEWEPDAAGLLRWTTPARTRDVEQAQRRQIYKAYLATQDYDPFAHRPSAYMTNMGASMQLINGILPIGLMTTSYCFSFVGMALGVLGVPVLAVISCYCWFMSLRNEYAICCTAKEPYMGLPRAVEFACRHGPHIFRSSATFFRYFVMSLSLLRSGFIVATSCYYIGYYLSAVLEELVGKHEPWVFILAISPFILLICSSMSANYVVPVATIGNATSLAGSILIVVAVLQETMGKTASIETAKFTIKHFPVFVCGTMNAINNVPMIYYTEKFMKKPQDLLKPWGVLSRTMIYIVLIQVLVAAVGYAGYGKDIKMILVLHLERDSQVTKSVFGCLMVTRYLVITANVFAMYDIVWEANLKSVFRGYPKGQQLLLGVTVRIVIAIICVTLAAALPNYLYYDAVTTAITVPVLVLAFPAFIELCLCWDLKNFGPFNYALVKDCVMIMFALYCLFFGVFEAIALIQRNKQIL